MTPHASHYTSFLGLVRNFVKHRQLVFQMVKREVIGRYKGSVIGLGWSFFNPILMLAVYTFVFSVVFKARWGIDASESKTQFAVVLFTGMIIHGFFAEVIGRAPTLILANVNYVKKVVFPLEFLPIIAVGAALFHVFIGVGVLLVVSLLFDGFFQWTLIFFPIILLPFVFLVLGGAWMLASLGVFIRDIGQAINLVITMLMFLSPVFYPVTALPERFRVWLFVNPLTFIIEQAREVLIFGQMPNFWGLTIYTSLSAVVAWLGFAWFQKTRKGFADVI